MQFYILINNIPKPQLIDKIDSFCITENNGLILDTLTLSISDSKNMFAIPEIGAEINITIASGAIAGNYLMDMGTFMVNKVESSSEHIYLYCISSINLTLGKDNKNRSFFYQSLKNVLVTLASELLLQVKVGSTIADTHIAYLLQNGMTNLQMLNELAELFNAIIKIKDKKLIFLPIQDLSKGVILKDTEILSIATNNLDGYQYKGVQSTIWNTEIGNNRTLRVGEEPYYYFHSPYIDLLFNIHIESMFAQLKMKQQLMIKTTGNPNIQAGFKLNLQQNTVYSDYKANWLIQQVSHNYSGMFSTDILAVKI